MIPAKVIQVVSKHVATKTDCRYAMEHGEIISEVSQVTLDDDDTLGEYLGLLPDGVSLEPEVRRAGFSVDDAEKRED